jgi:hypothetical protein
MESQQETQALAQLLSLEIGRSDALMAAVTGILQVAGRDSEIAKAVGARLELHYSGSLAESWSDHYMRGFESVRDYIAATLQ